MNGNTHTNVVSDATSTITSFSFGSISRDIAIAGSLILQLEMYKQHTELFPIDQVTWSLLTYLKILRHKTMCSGLYNKIIVKKSVYLNILYN